MKTRIIWAIIMIVISYFLVAVANDIVFTIIVGLMSLIAMKELIDTQEKVPGIIKIEMIAFLAFACGYTYFWGMLDIHYFVILFIVLNVSLVLYQHIEKYNFTDISVAFTMCSYLVFGFTALINIKLNFSILVFAYPIFVAILADTFGYFGGMLFGKRKLIVNISPKKTWEGAISATLFAGLFSYFYLQQFDLTSTQVIVISVVVVILSQLGDLVASAIKRTYDIKDYSNLIPGHGGILDRFDSILFNFIVISVVLIYI